MKLLKPFRDFYLETYVSFQFAGAVSGQLSIILHCVQKFLIIVVDVCPDLEPNDRRRLAICSRGLLRQSEEAKYAPINESLARTRTFYIQVWCALLCVPFAVD